MMGDTENALELMQAVNPVPSLEELAVDDLDLVRDIVARGVAVTTPVKEQPQAHPDQLTRRWKIYPALAAGLAFILVFGALGGALLLFRGSDTEPAGPERTIAEGFTCPPGSTADQPGPANQLHPQGLDSQTTFDPGWGRALILKERPQKSPMNAFWMFDVCANTWTAAPRPADIGFVSEFVYDVDSDRAIAFAKDTVGAKVWAYEPNGQGWTRMSNFAVDPLFQAVYDPVTGLVVVRATTSQMWTYDVDTDTWTEVDQGATLPPAGAESDVQLLTYDASVDRLILYVIYGDPLISSASTWEFDIRIGRWEPQTVNTLPLGLWAGDPSIDEFVYDEANQVSVIFGGRSSTQLYVATYDASEHSWTELHWGPIPVVGDAHWFPYLAVTYDPANERILVFGDDTNAVIAFDVATGEWIILLEPNPEWWRPS